MSLDREKFIKQVKDASEEDLVSMTSVIEQDGRIFIPKYLSISDVKKYYSDKLEDFDWIDIGGLVETINDYIQSEYNSYMEEQEEDN